MTMTLTMTMTMTLTMGPLSKKYYGPKNRQTISQNLYVVTKKEMVYSLIFHVRCSTSQKSAKGRRLKVSLEDLNSRKKWSSQINTQGKKRTQPKELRKYVFENKYPVIHPNWVKLLWHCCTTRLCGDLSTVLDDRQFTDVYAGTLIFPSCRFFACQTICFHIWQ